MTRRDDARIPSAAWTAWAAARDEAQRRERRRRSLLASGVVLAVAIGIGGVVAGLWMRSMPEPAPVEAVAAPPPQVVAAPAKPAKPVVWVQAGHAPPLEPGYRGETGAVDGPFETEAGFTLPVAQRVVRQLRSWGADARLVKGKVTPLAAPGAVFLSIHHDAEGGQAAVAWATEPKAPLRKRPGRRAPTQVDAVVERDSRHLAVAIHERFSQAFRAGNGARTELGPPLGPRARRDLREYYGFFRTKADARVIVEAGAAGDDDRFLERTGLIAGTLAAGVRDHLIKEGLLRR